ncbi:uncharacterized protein At2g29880-like [Juglans microcarpa x Juglans regia]|uniref:uncharacterized protein At2g29880-like n=1 Tax=Juglans microcarpa x Juglans regia TaxID=2249226 RepID=UPI001B7D94FB|nr:uncharacterized protein At2g29880-like [Juglans microcarpa x Juglans regia]
MSAGLDGVTGRPKAEWTPSRDAYLVELFIGQHNCGRTAYNEFKNEVIRSVTRDFNKKFDLNLEENQIKNRYNVMKKDYGVVKTLLGHDGFGWDETRHMVVADDKVWDNYIAVRSEARPFRRKSFPLYKQMTVIFEGERSNSKYQLPSGVPVATEEGNSNTETVRSSEPSNLPTQVVDGTLDSDSIIHVNDMQPKKRKSFAMTALGRKKRACYAYKAGETIENALYEIFSAAKFKAMQRNASNENTLYQKCLEDLQQLEELDDSEFTKAVNVLRDDKNAIAFMTIKGPRRLTWLRSLWQA